MGSKRSCTVNRKESGKQRYFRNSDQTLAMSPIPTFHHNGDQILNVEILGTK